MGEENWQASEPKARVRVKRRNERIRDMRGFYQSYIEHKHQKFKASALLIAQFGYIGVDLGAQTLYSLFNRFERLHLLKRREHVIRDYAKEVDSSF